MFSELFSLKRSGFNRITASPRWASTKTVQVRISRDVRFGKFSVYTLRKFSKFGAFESCLLESWSSTSHRIIARCHLAALSASTYCNLNPHVKRRRSLHFNTAVGKRVRFKKSTVHLKPRDTQSARRALSTVLKTSRETVKSRKVLKLCSLFATPLIIPLHNIFWRSSPYDEWHQKASVLNLV